MRKVSEFDELYQKYYKDVYYYLKTLSQDETIAEDLTAETFLQIYINIHKFRGECDIRRWICKIAKNQYFSYCRKNGRECSVPEYMEIPDERVSVEQSLVDSETAKGIHQFLHQMEEPYKEVFTLRVFCELPYKQIGELFGKTEGWARVTFLRAKCQIQKWMEGQSYEK